MTNSYILTLSGPDRIGIVEAVTRRVLKSGGNVETSRMARLGGEFAILMRIRLPEAASAGLEDDLRPLADEGYTFSLVASRAEAPTSKPGWIAYEIEVEGADHEGIVHQVARVLSGHGINIETLETELVLAPMSGSPMFLMSGRLAVPPGLDSNEWQTGLREIADRMNLEIITRPSRLD